MLLGINPIGITNASPLIYLGKLSKLEILKSIFTEVFTTEEVKKEVLKLESAPEHVVLTEAFKTWLKTRKPQNQPLITQLEKLQIHKGEASILVLAKETQSQNENNVVIIDDLAARDIAQIMGLTVTGTVGILLRGVKDNHLTIKQCKTLLTKLNTETDFRMTIKVYSKILEYLESII